MLELLNALNVEVSPDTSLNATHADFLGFFHPAIYQPALKRYAINPDFSRRLSRGIGPIHTIPYSILPRACKGPIYALRRPKIVTNIAMAVTAFAFQSAIACWGKEKAGAFGGARIPAP